MIMMITIVISVLFVKLVAPILSVKATTAPFMHLGLEALWTNAGPGSGKCRASGLECGTIGLPFESRKSKDGGN